jgi:hypothetical protein
MKRLVPVSAMVILALALGGCRSAQDQPPQKAESAAPAVIAVPPPPPPPPPLPCKAIRDRNTTYEIRVFANGSVSDECLEIAKPNRTTVVWVAQEPATQVEITWKPRCEGGVSPSVFPARPTQSADRSTLGPEAYEPITRPTELCYTVKVTSPGLPPVIKDPKLIINP